MSIGKKAIQKKYLSVRKATVSAAQEDPSFSPVTLLVSSSVQAVVIRMYGRRADSKNRIKELKEDFGATAGPVHYAYKGQPFLT
jgi:hypothetical protein